MTLTENQERIKKYDEIVILLQELKQWALKCGDLQDWEEGDKFFGYDWNQDKTDGYMFALFPIHEKLCRVLGEKTIVDAANEIVKE